MEERTAHRKVRTGTVVSDKMEKTIVVRVDPTASLFSVQRNSWLMMRPTTAAWATQSR